MSGDGGRETGDDAESEPWWWTVRPCSELNEWPLVRADRTGWLESMHNTGGDWTKIADRGPLNVNEHVNFYAKVGDY